MPISPPEQAETGDDPLDACERAIASVRQKANRNERLARWAAGLIIVSSALIPLAIILSTEFAPFFWGKIIPSALAAVAAVAAGLLQVERPHERWRLYRGYQRRLEAERLRFENRVAPYELDDAARRKLLAETVATLVLRLHDEWSGLVPISADVAQRDKAISAVAASPRGEEKP